MAMSKRLQDEMNESSRRAARRRAQQSTGQAVVEEEEPGYEGPLDLLSRVVAAYGVRALSAAMLGQNIFRLRRDSDDAEMDFAADAVTGDAPVASINAWLGAADGFLVTLYDQNAGGHDLEWGEVAEQMQWQESLQGGKCGFVPGAGATFTVSSATDATLANGEVSILLVGRQAFRFGVGNLSEFIYGELRTGLDVNPAVELYNDTTGADCGGQTNTPNNNLVLYSTAAEFGAKYLNINGAAQTFQSTFDAVGASPSLSKPVYLRASDEGLQFCEGIICDEIPSGAAETAASANMMTYYGIS